MLYVPARNASNHAISTFMFHNFGIISLKLVTFVSVPVFFIFSPHALMNKGKRELHCLLETSKMLATENTEFTEHSLLTLLTLLTSLNYFNGGNRSLVRGEILQPC
jgi:hypothetical protein